MPRTLDDDAVLRLAEQHEAARRTRNQIRRVTLAHPGMTIEDSYACQTAWVDLQRASGARVAGHKIGLTSRAMQRTMNIDEPDFGVLLDDMMHMSGAVLQAADYCDPQIEVELAFVLGAPLHGDAVSVTDVLAATDYVVPALELIDARSFRTDPTDGVTRTVRDTITDNAADAGVILGDVHIDPRAVDLRWIGAILRVNDVVEETGLAAGVLDDPVLGIAWLARRLAGFGTGLGAGEVVLCGSFTRPVRCRAGDRIAVDYGAFGEVSVTFE
jgi:2-oxo-hept-3-ene-1,7-dioate hydratase